MSSLDPSFDRGEVGGARCVAVTFAAALAACGPRAAPPAAPSAVPAPDVRDPLRLSAAEDRAEGVGTFTSIPWGFATNSFWIEGPDGVVVIDTQFLPSEAERLLEVIGRSTAKPVVLAIVLHPNPDKFNGADVLRARGVRVVSAAQVIAQVPAVAASRRRSFLARYAPDYPDHDPVIEAFGDRTTTLRAAGLELTLHVLGRGASEAHVVVEHRGHLFGGDLLVSQTHAWLELGYVRDWIARMEELRALAPRRVHPGRGPSGGPEILDGTRGYLERVLERVAAARPTLPAPEGAVDAVRAQLERDFAGHGYPIFLKGLGEVWAAEARRAALPLE